ncbi:hypothetical protein Tco_1282828 [Tanacetum coccineum]
MMEKDIENMTIVEYMEYEAEMKRQSWRDAQSYFPTKYENTDINSFNSNKSRVLGYAHHSDDSKINAYYELPLLLPCFKPVQPHTKDRYEPLKEDTNYVSEDELETGEQRISNDTYGYKPFTPEPQHEDVGLSFDENLYEWEPSETMILGRPFLATIHAQINVFKREISLGIGEDRVKFDMDRGVSHSRIPVEKIYMANAVHEEEYFIPLEIEDDVFSYESPACLLFEQCTQSCDNESVDTLNSADNMQELEDKHEDMVRGPNLERIISRWHMCKLVRVFYDNECGKYYEMWPTCNSDLSFCSGYDTTYGKGENGMLEQWMCFRDHERQSVDVNHMIFTDFLKSVSKAVLNEWVLDSFDIKTNYGRTRDDSYSRRFDEYKEVFDSEIEQLENEYDLRIGKKGYDLDNVWEKCEKFHGGTSHPWHDEGFEEEDQWESDDALPLGRANESRFMGMIRKEMDEERSAQRKT